MSDRDSGGLNVMSRELEAGTSLSGHGHAVPSQQTSTPHERGAWGLTDCVAFGQQKLGQLFANVTKCACQEDLHRR